MARSKNFAPTIAPEGPIVDDEVGRLFESSQARDAQARLRDLPVDRIDPNPFQARHEFTDIDELANTIRSQGFTSRLRVRPHPDQDGRFQLVYGERRLRAAIAAELTRVPVEILAHSDDQMIEIGLAENIQRQALTPLEEARGLQVLMDRHGYSQRTLADRIGKTAGYVQNRLDLLRAPEDVQRLVAQRPDSLRAARSIARLPDPVQRRSLIAELLSDTLTGDDVEVRVRDLLAPVGRTSTQDLLDRSSPEQADAVSQGSVEDRQVHAASDGAADQPTHELSASRRRGAHAGARESAMARILTTDVLRLDVILSRWRQAVASATDDERRSFARYLREHLGPQLEALQDAAETGENTQDARGRV